MPACPHCGHVISSDELGDLLTGIGTAAPPVASGGTTASERPLQSYLKDAPFGSLASIGLPEPALGHADARGPEAAGSDDTPVFGL